MIDTTENTNPTDPTNDAGKTQATEEATPSAPEQPETAATPSDAAAGGVGAATESGAEATAGNGPAETVESDASASAESVPASSTAAETTETSTPTPAAEASAATEAVSASVGESTTTDSTETPAASVVVEETPASPEELAATAAAVAAKAEADRIEAEKKAAEEAEKLEAMKPVWQELTEKKESRETFTAKVTGTNRGGIVAEYNGVEIFVPQSHWSLERSSEVDPTIVGNEFEMSVLEITQFDTDARRVTGSRRSILRKELIESLEPGLRLKGRVSSLTDFGAFVDLGGIDGLLHVTEISHARSAAPKDLLKKGEEIEVIVKKVEKGGKRISLGRKELLDSPWKGVAEKYQTDSVVSGKVVSLTDIGAFIQLEPGVDGLLRPREMSWTKRVGQASDMLSVGQEVEVMVTSVNEEDERIGLSLKRTGENPWDSIVEKFSDAEATWEASVVEVSNKGAVVSVEEIEGFLPRGRMGRESSKLTELTPGDKLTVNVIEVDPKRPSLIFSLPGAGRSGGGGQRGSGGGERQGGGGGGRRGGPRRDRDFQASKAVPNNEMKSSKTVSNFSLGDMLESVMKEKLGVEEQEETPAKSPENPQSGASGDKKEDGASSQESAAPVTEDVPVVTADSSSETVNAPLSPQEFQNVDGTPEQEGADAPEATSEETESAAEETTSAAETPAEDGSSDGEETSGDSETPTAG